VALRRGLQAAPQRDAVWERVSRQGATQAATRPLTRHRPGAQPRHRARMV